MGRGLYSLIPIIRFLCKLINVSQGQAFGFGDREATRMFQQHHWDGIGKSASKGNSIHCASFARSGFSEQPLTASWHDLVASCISRVS